MTINRQAAAAGRWLRCGIAGVLCLAACAGCSRGPATYPVSGTVTLDGQPVPLGTVLFQPVATEAGASYTARANIGPAGEYRLSTFGNQDGAVAGVYRVTVMAQRYDLHKTSGNTLLVPLRYTSPDTSGLEFEVKPGDNPIDLELRSAP